MITIRTDVLTLYLKIIGRNQSWLAKKCGFTKGYMSRIKNNDCKMSREVIDRFLLVSNMPFDHLFKNDGRPDTREWFGEVFVVNGQPMQKQAYYDKIRRENISLDFEKKIDYASH